MHLTILTLGSRGDVQPYAALGLGLRRAGYDVVVATHGLFRDWLVGLGLSFAQVEGNPRELLEGEIGRQWLESGGNSLRFVRKIFELAAPLAERMARDCWAACQGSDAILFSPLGMAAVSIAEKLGVPSIPAFLQPLARNSAHSCMGMDGGRSLPGFLNYASYIVFEQMMWQMGRRMENRFRRDLLGLPPYEPGGPYGRIYRQKRPFLLGYSSHVVPRPAEWDDTRHVTGYWFLDRPASWTPPADLEAFLADGPPPVYVGFGSMTPRDAGGLADMVVGALRSAGARGVLLSGWGGLDRRDADNDILVVDNVPHDWLFPRMAAVVHHGGAGTTGAGARAGVPSLVLPFFADQPFWGRRMDAIGAGPEPIPQKRLTLPGLTAALRQVLTDDAMRQRAARLGEAIRAEDGVAAAVTAIGQILGGPEDLRVRRAEPAATGPTPGAGTRAG